MAEAENGFGTPQGTPTVDVAGQMRALRNGANWFYWIAGLSVVNSLISLFQGTLGFIFGLGVTRIVDVIAAMIVNEGSGPVLLIRIIALGVSMFFAGICVLFGWLANQKQGWAFLVGMVLYALDGLLFLLIQDWWDLAFHGFALFCIFQGYTALRKLKAAVAPAAPPQVEYDGGA